MEVVCLESAHTVSYVPTETQRLLIKIMKAISSTNSHGMRDRFRKISAKFFSASAIDATAFSLCPDIAGHDIVHAERIRSVSDLENHLRQAVGQTIFETILVIPQPFSWGRFKITESAFTMVLDSMKIFDEFLEIVSGFGVKTSEDERVVYGSRSCSARRQCPRPRHEICYSILHIERHNRSLQDPWSLRQTGVYHQFSGEMATSRWIFLNLGESLQRFPQDFLVAKIANEHCQLGLHVRLLNILGSNWIEYIEYLELELRKLKDKATYSRVDNGGYQGFNVSYADIQELYLLQTKIYRAQAAIESGQDIARSCQKHYLSHSSLIGKKLSTRIELVSLNNYLAAMARHRSALRRLHRGLHSTLNLLSRILMFRNEELLQASNQASNSTLRTLLTLTDQGARQQEALTALAISGQANSIMIKVLSIVATIFLPASLIATVFSSNLIQSVDQNIQTSSLRLILSPQFWIFLAITLPLMGATLAGSILLDYRSHIVTKKAFT